MKHRKKTIKHDETGRKKARTHDEKERNNNDKL